MQHTLALNAKSIILETEYNVKQKRSLGLNFSFGEHTTLL